MQESNRHQTHGICTSKEQGTFFLKERLQKTRLWRHTHKCFIIFCTLYLKFFIINYFTKIIQKLSWILKTQHIQITEKINLLKMYVSHWSLGGGRVQKNLEFCNFPSVFINFVMLEKKWLESLNTFWYIFCRTKLQSVKPYIKNRFWILLTKNGE